MSGARRGVAGGGRARPPGRARLGGRGGRAGDAGVAASVSVDLIRRIPANLASYRRWLRAWADLSTRDDADLAAIGQQHGISKRQMAFVRRAGQAGLLDAPLPPAHPLAQLARTSGWPTPNHTTGPGHTPQRP